MRSAFGSWSQPARNVPVSGRLCQIQSWLVGPAIASSSAAAARTVRASGAWTGRALISELSGGDGAGGRAVHGQPADFGVERRGRDAPPPGLDADQAVDARRDADRTAAV